MRGSIDGTEVYMNDGQLPAFTLSINSITDPSKVQGAASSTIKVVATKEARRVFGPEGMAHVRRSDRPVLRIGEDSVDLFRANVQVMQHDRDTIDVIGVAGNASWFQEAKGLKLRELPMGETAPLDSAMQIASWTNEDQAIYFPLIDFGSFEGRTSSYNVPVTGLRPAIRTHKLFEAGGDAIGYRIVPRGRVVECWKKLYLLDPKVNPSVSEPGPYPTDEIFSTSLPSPDGYYFIPTADGTLDVVCTDLQVNFLNTDTTYDGYVFRVILYDFTQRKVLAFHDVPATYFGDADYGALRISHTFTGVPVRQGNSLFVAIQCYDIEEPEPIVLDSDASTVEYNLNSGAQTLKLRPSLASPFYALTEANANVGYFASYKIDIAACAPDWTLDKLFTTIANACCLVFDTDVANGVVNVWFDNEYHRKPTPVANVRDWTTRMDHTLAPEVVTPSVPRRTILKYASDENDRFLKRAERRVAAEFGYASHVQVNPMGNAPDKTVDIPCAPTVNGRLFGTCNVPIMRKVDGDYQVDEFDRSVRLLIADGVESGAWRFDSVDRTEFPVSYFSRPDPVIALPFGNAAIYDEAVPVASATTWLRRLEEQRRALVLRAAMLIRDHELQDFDHGMPTLVDDGSGPAWYYVQEIQQHRFGLHQPTKCLLVQIPGKEVNIPEVEQPPIEYVSDPEPLACPTPNDWGTTQVNFNTPSAGQYTISLTPRSDYGDGWRYGGAFYIVDGVRHYIEGIEVGGSAVTIGPFANAKAVRVQLRNALRPDCTFEFTAGPF